MSLQMNVSIPYGDLVELEQDSAQKKAIVSIINTKFPDDTCQLIAIKSVLGIEEEKTEEPSEPIVDPVDPEPEP